LAAWRTVHLGVKSSGERYDSALILLLLLILSSSREND